MFLLNLFSQKNRLKLLESKYENFKMLKFDITFILYIYI